MTGLNEKQIDEVERFHGHWCPGLAIGIRVSELALLELGARAKDEELVAVVETGMCGVDAIQYLTGCTLGKGNLILRDYGKMAFSFYRRVDGRRIRIVMNPQQQDAEVMELRKKKDTVGLSATEEQRWAQWRKLRSEGILKADLKQLFSVNAHEEPIPARARMLPSLRCEACGEATMESRTRRLLGQVLCIPCFDALDKR
jgi:formylmethanofuran dehydrogenase subunit E